MLNLLVDEILGLPLWALIVIIAAVLILIVIIVTVAVVLSKKSKKDSATTAKKAEGGESAKSETAQSGTVAKTSSKSTAGKTAAKTSNKVYHISKRKEDGMWQIKAAGGEKAIKLFKTQKEAISYCKTLADNQEANIMIHKEDGSFRKLTY